MNDDENVFFQTTFRAALGHTWLFFRVISAGLVLLYLLSGIYSVSQNEIAVHLRFGRIIDEKVQPGIHYMLPWPIDRVEKVAVRQVKRLAVDDFWGTPDNAQNPNSFKSITGLDSYCITGDNNLAMISCVIQYRVLNPREYLFCVKDPDIMLKELACKSILHCMASMPIDEMLTKGKQSVATYIRQALQKRLDHLETGIRVSFVEINNISPPARVARYFSEVVKASIDRERNINEAQSYRNEVIPRGKADAVEIMEQAGGYKQAAILIAEGKTRRFNKLLAQVKEKRRAVQVLLYTEFMKDIMKNVGAKQIVDKDKTDQPIVNLRIKSLQ